MSQNKSPPYMTIENKIKLVSMVHSTVWKQFTGGTIYDYEFSTREN